MRKAFLAGLIRAALAAALVVAAGPAAPARAQENPYDTLVDVRMGQRVFRAQCGRCHGRDARGNDETGAPDLTAGRFTYANSDAGMFDVIRNGIDGTAMIGISPRASDQTVWQIAAYIDSLYLDPDDFELAGDAGRGREIYEGRGNCASCHMIDGAGGRLGPDLTTVGDRLTPDEIAAALTDPNEEVLPRWWTVRVTRADGSVVEGLRMNEDNVHPPDHGRGREPLELPEERGPLVRADQDVHHAGDRRSGRGRDGRSGRLALLAAEGTLT